jgi:ribosomal protein S18 acetylase RimI-like enzyme
VLGPDFSKDQDHPAQVPWLDEPTAPCTFCAEARNATLAFRPVWSVMSHPNVTFRPAQAKDALHLACLFDLASRGLAAWCWSQIAEPGQSLIEVGRRRIAENADHVSHFSSWIVAEIDASIAGAVLGYRIPDPYDPGDMTGITELHRPVLELEAIAAGTWFIMAIGVFAEFRGRGLGKQLLERSIEKAMSIGATSASIMVESANVDAYRLYLRFGFVDWDRRPYHPFPGSRDSGEWILLRRPLL